MASYSPACPPCRFPDDCACEQGIAFQEKMEDGERTPLRRRARCIHGEVEDVWITEAYTNGHGAGASGRCGRGYKHLFSLTEKEYKVVSEALQQPRLL